jgi:phage gp37-like protein
MDPILATEDAIVAGAKAALGFNAVPPAPVVRKVETLPGNWTIESLQRALQSAPGVYVAFLGGTKNSDGGYIDARFALYAVTKGAREDERRRGNPREIGAYEIVSILGAGLDRLDVPNIGTLFVKGVENVFGEAMFEIGGTVYALTLELPNLPWDEKDISGLAPFITFEGTHSMAPGVSEPAHQTKVTLPQ